jgi:SAM-dependent methyltransferase
MAKRGARKVIGVDIRESVLAVARTRARMGGIDDTCSFTTETDLRAQLIVSVDAFEHFGDPAQILNTMASLLEPGGSVWIAFGPPWYHPAGGHLFSIFPWAHLLFTEATLIRWRSDFKSDGAMRFSEVDGGLNQMTIRRFERLIAASPFRFDRFELVPIRRLRRIWNRATREFFTSVVRCRLVCQG